MDKVESKFTAPPHQKKYRELAKLFHSDKLGDDKMMKDLNLAYEEAQRGNPSKLLSLYGEWSGEAIAKKEILARIGEDLSNLSSELFEAARKGKTWGRTEKFEIERHYRDLCKEERIDFDSNFLAQFLFSEGWIDEEERDRRSTLENS